jgi:mono/diheme cytochrome c family protein
VFRTFIGAGAVACIATVAVSQDIDPGQSEYMIACAGCHGESAKGDGPIAGLLEIETPDLTGLAQRAGGTFPYEQIVLVVDGRNEIRAHGSEMPVWGDRYFVSAMVSDSLDPQQGDMVARGRVLALANYLSSIQQ